jgi:hypothetical protein
VNRIGLSVVLIGNIVVACTNNFSVSIILAETFAPTHRGFKYIYMTHVINTSIMVAVTIASYIFLCVDAILWADSCMI